MPAPRDITDADPGRGGQGARLAVIGLAASVIAGTVYLAAEGAKPAPARPTLQLPARSVGLLGAAFPDYASGWLLTGQGASGGKLWRTQDGGKTWSLAIQLDHRSTFGRLGLGSESGFLATTSVPQGTGRSRWFDSYDGGRTFDSHPFPDPPGFVLEGVSTPPDGSAFALFSDERFPATAIFYGRSPDASWAPLSTLRPAVGTPSIPLFGDRTSMAFLDGRRGVIATNTDTDNPALYVTADGGRTWTVQWLPIIAVDPPGTVAAFATNGVLIVSVAYHDGLGVIVRPPARSVLYMSYDGGATWAGPTYLPTKDGMEAPAFPESDVWWVPMGTSVSVTRDAGADWLVTGLGLPATAKVDAIYPVDERRAWAFAGFGSGPPQLLFETDDGGATWTARRPPA